MPTCLTKQGGHGQWERESRQRLKDYLALPREEAIPQIKMMVFNLGLGESWEAIKSEILKADYMKSFALMVSLLVWPCAAKEIASDMKKPIKEVVSNIVKLAADSKSKELQSLLVQNANDEKARHAATPARLIGYFKGVDFKKIEYGMIQESEDKSSVMVRIISPINLDMDFKVVSRDPFELKLQSVHP